MLIVYAHDLAWNGWGSCLAVAERPLSVQHARLGGLAWRWPGVLRHLNGPIAAELCDAESMRRETDPRVRMVIEEPPAVYSGASRGKPGRPAGNQAMVGYGLGRLAGAVELWSEQRGDLAYPWLVEPGEWRKWWRLGGKGRYERKVAARDLVRAMRWGHLLEPFDWPADPDEAGGAQGDVAEAILLAVGAARNPTGAPKGPAQRALPGITRARAPKH